jgi:hypothetical protein
MVDDLERWHSRPIDNVRLKLGNKDKSNQKWTNVYATTQGSTGHIGRPGLCKLKYSFFATNELSPTTSYNISPEEGSHYCLSQVT